jgi:hypothetical protein
MGKIVYRYTDAKFVEHGPAFVPLRSMTHRITSTTGRHSHDDTLLRCKSKLLVIMRIPPVGGPPLEALERLSVMNIAAFHVSNQFFMPPADSNSRDVLLSDYLDQRITPDLERAGGYIVRWEQSEASETTSMRKGDGIGAGPYVNFGLEWYDPEGATNDALGYLFWWNATVLVKSWWGSTHL